MSKQSFDAIDNLGCCLYHEYMGSGFKKFVFIFIALIILIPLLIFASTFKSQKISKDSSKTFSVVESWPEHGDNSFSAVSQPTFVFSKKIGILEKDLNDYFQIDPKPQGSWHLEENKQVVYFSSDKKQPEFLPNTLAYDTIYSVAIDKNLKSMDGQKLDKEIKLNFRTRKNQKFGFYADQKLISVFTGEKITTTFYQNEVKSELGNPLIIVKTASLDQLLKYFSHKGDKYPLYRFIPNEENKEIIKLNDYSLENFTQSQNTLSITLPGIKDPGLYIATLQSVYGSEDFFIIVSNHINQVFESNQETYVWTTDSKEGKNLANVNAEFYSLKDSAHLLSSGTTNSNGLFKMKNEKNNVDIVITKNGADLAVSSAFTWGYYERSVKTDNFNVYSYTDRPIYRPGDAVHYKAVIRKRENGTFVIPKGNLYLKLLTDYTDDQNKDSYTEVSIDENGTVTADFKLPPNLVGAYPQIVLYAKNGSFYRQIDSFSVASESYRKPDMEIMAFTTEKEYISKDSSHITVFAKTLYGKPLSNVDFTYRVIVNDYSEIKDRSLESIDSMANPYYGTGKELISGSGRFDAKGKASIIFSTDLSNFELSQIAMLEITPKIGASPSIGKIAKLIHRGETALFFENVKAETKNGITGEILVLDHNKPRREVLGQSVSVSLYKEISYGNKEFVKTIDATESATPVINFSFPEISTGRYELVAKTVDKRENTITSRYTVYLEEYSQPVPNSSIPYFFKEIKKQKSSYKSGEAALIDISANFPISDVLTAITYSKGTKISQNYVGKNEWTIPINLESDFGESVGVDIFTVYRGFVISGHEDIKIETPQKKIITKISFDKQKVKPKDTVNIKISTKDILGNPVSSDNSLSVIDGAILQIKDYSRSDIFDHFYYYSPTYRISSYDSTQDIENQRGGGGGGGCFLEGTKIRMNDGSLKNIEDVIIGDKIKTRESSVSNLPVSDRVTKTFRHIVPEYLTINDSFNVTPIHRIFLNNKWQEASKAKVGDFLLDEYGNFVKIESIRKNLGQFEVYNLSTEKYHTFFAGGFYVHNDKGADIRQNFVDTAYWNPHIKTDKNGEANVSVKVPDNVTTFTAKAVSNSKDSKFGQSVEEFISEKEIVIIPGIPNFYYQSDKPEISAIVQNSSGKNLDAIFSLSIKELNYSKEKPIGIKDGDFEEVSFPVEINKKIDNLSFIFEVKNKSDGGVLDSVLLKKPILQQGNIDASWASFEGTKEIEFTSKYPQVDFNRISISAFPHIISNIKNSNFYFAGDISTELGENLYAYSNLLENTRMGKIPPNLYKYAKLKNDFRDKVNFILENKTTSALDTYWNSKYGYDSTVFITSWITKGLAEAQRLHLLDEITEISSVINKGIKYLKTGSPPNNPPIVLPGVSQDSSLPPVKAPIESREDQLMKKWLLGDSFKTDYENEPEFLAVSVLSGDTKAIVKLLDKKLPSAKDRYVFDGESRYGQMLPVLALIEKGSKEDADKAVKGLSLTSGYSGYNSSKLDLLAGLIHSTKYNINPDDYDFKLTVNDEVVYEGDKDGFSKVFSTQNVKSGKTRIKTKHLGSLPFYTTIINTQFKDESENINKSAWEDIKQNIFVSAVTEGKIMNKKIERSFRNIPSFGTTSNVKAGETAAIVLYLDNPFKIYNKTDRYYNSIYNFSLTDAISPSFMFLDQSSGNSPQYQSVLDTLFPGGNQYDKGYTGASDYSDQAVFFSGYSRELRRIILPYIIYAVSNGKHHQPKTTLVFPNLGVLIKER